MITAICILGGVCWIARNILIVFAEIGERVYNDEHNNESIS